MLLFPSARFQKRHTNVQRTPRALPRTLVLVEAIYDETSALLFLTFDRAVDIAAVAAAQVTVADGTFTVTLFGGVGPVALESPTTVRIPLEWIDDAPPAPVTMNASALTGIVAVDDGGTWAGVSGVGLPYDA